jgi:lipoyl(octanoyl) transferase
MAVGPVYPVAGRLTISDEERRGATGRGGKQRGGGYTEAAVSTAPPSPPSPSSDALSPPAPSSDTPSDTRSIVQPGSPSPRGEAPRRETVPGRLLDLGRREYGEVWELQRELVAARQRDEIPDTLVLVEHPDVITLGRGTHRENLLRPDDMPVFEIERGGDVTYHGPGQLVGYPIFLLRQAERDLHRYLRDLEESLIRGLADLGLPTERRPGWTGAWTVAQPARKLASIGVAVKRWVTLHGFALNVSTNLTRFAAINPCGLEATVMTSVSACLGRSVPLEEVRRPLVQHLSAIFARDFRDA